MKCNVDREQLLMTLQRVSGVIEKRHTQPVLSHVLLHIKSHQMRIIGSDLEVEICALTTLPQPAEAGDLTLPARKLLDICRALPEKCNIELEHFQQDKVLLKAGQSKFTLTTLPAESYPQFELSPSILEFSISQSLLKTLIERTFFSIAQQDVRYYLNGLLLQVREGILRSVGTDGHRLSLFKTNPNLPLSDCEVIIPRKGIMELQRLLVDENAEVKISVTEQHIRVQSSAFIFTSKRIEGRFPDYESVVPKQGDKILKVDRDLWKQSLLRVSILSNEKYKGIKLELSKNMLRLMSRNPEQEEAEEELEVEYEGENLEIGFNVTYLLDVLNHIPQGEVKLTFSNGSSPVLIQSSTESENSSYVVMPMRL